MCSVPLVLVVPLLVSDIFNDLLLGVVNLHLFVDVDRLDGIAKELANVLQRPAFRLGEIKPDGDGDDGGNGDEHDIIPPADRGERGGRGLEEDDRSHE